MRQFLVRDKNSIESKSPLQNCRVILFPVLELDVPAKNSGEGSGESQYERLACINSHSQFVSVSLTHRHVTFAAPTPPNSVLHLWREIWAVVCLTGWVRSWSRSSSRVSAQFMHALGAPLRRFGFGFTLPADSTGISNSTLRYGECRFLGCSVTFEIALTGLPVCLISGACVLRSTYPSCIHCIYIEKRFFWWYSIFRPDFQTL